MRSCTSPNRPATHRIRTAAWATALALTFTAPEAARAQSLGPPNVPPSLQPPAGNVVFLAARGIGTQNYVCLPSTTSATGFAWSLFTPQATLFSDQKRQVAKSMEGVGTPERVIQLREHAWKYEPSEIRIKRGEVVKIEFSASSIACTFTIPKTVQRRMSSCA